MDSQRLSKPTQLFKYIRQVFSRLRARITKRRSTPYTDSTSLSLSLTSVSQQTIYSVATETYNIQNSTVTSSQKAERSSGPQTKST
jgi:hypothetical protein